MSIHIVSYRCALDYYEKIHALSQGYNSLWTHFLKFSPLHFVMQIGLPTLMIRDPLVNIVFSLRIFTAKSGFTFKH